MKALRSTLAKQLLATPAGQAGMRRFLAGQDALVCGYIARYVPKAGTTQARPRPQYAEPATPKEPA